MAALQCRAGRLCRLQEKDIGCRRLACWHQACPLVAPSRYTQPRVQREDDLLLGGAKEQSSARASKSVAASSSQTGMCCYLARACQRDHSRLSSSVRRCHHRTDPWQLSMSIKSAGRQSLSVVLGNLGCLQRHGHAAQNNNCVIQCGQRSWRVTVGPRRRPHKVVKANPAIQYFTSGDRCLLPSTTSDNQ